jgi:hypothetical protein
MHLNITFGHSMTEIFVLGPNFLAFILIVKATVKPSRLAASAFLGKISPCPPGKSTERTQVNIVVNGERITIAIKSALAPRAGNGEEKTAAATASTSANTSEGTEPNPSSISKVGTGGTGRRVFNEQFAGQRIILSVEEKSVNSGKTARRAALTSNGEQLTVALFSGAVGRLPPPNGIRN